MKLDKITFGKLVKYISLLNPQDFFDVEELDNIVDMPIPEAQPVKANCAEVDYLLKLMSEGNLKIEAIKAYRTLTGAGLKDAKDAVEKYWISKGGTYQPSSATLGDILGKVVEK